MTPSISCDLKTLKDKAIVLSSKKNKGVDELEALAEVWFRIALNTAVSENEAIRLLKRANRIDGTNPRYAYHIARIHFCRGELESAAAWLNSALSYCPTSHRIWAHVSLLQHELDKQYKGDDRFEPDALLKRGECIAEGIMNGVDSFDPDLMDFKPPISLAAREAKARKERERNPTSAMATADKKQDSGEVKATPTVKRMSRPGVCRWTGMVDLTVERLLTREPSTGVRDKLVARMENVLDLTGKRKAGTTAFAVLAIECLLAGPPEKPGYSPAIIRDLLSRIEATPEDKAVELVKIVCDLFEADIDRLPELLSTALERKKIPTALCALIHAKRLFWRPLVFGAIDRYLTAKTLIKNWQQAGDDQDQEEEALTLIKRINVSRRYLVASPPEPVPPGEQKQTEEAIDARCAQMALETLSSIVGEVESIRAQATIFLKEQLEPLIQEMEHADSAGRVTSDFRAFNHLLDEIDMVADLGIDAVARLSHQVENLNADELAPSFVGELERIDKLFKSLKLRQAKKTLKKIENAVKKIFDPQTASPTEASPVLAGFTARLQKVSHSLTLKEQVADEPIETRLGVLNEEAVRLKEKLDSFWNRLKELEVAKGEGDLTDQEIRDGQLINRFAAELETITDRALKELETLRERPDFKDAVALEKTVKEFQNISSGKFKKKLRKLALPEAEEAPEPCSGQKQHQISPKVLSGVQGIAETLDGVDTEIDGLISFYRNSFRTYSPKDRQHPAIRRLEIRTLSQAAELLFMLGKYRRAEKLWQDVLVLDGLSTATLNNTAVCRTLLGSDHSHVLLSWKYYLEVLYFLDVVSGDPRPLCIQRANFHKTYGSAFCCGFPLEEFENQKSAEKDNEVAFCLLLNSGGSIRELISHTLCEIMNLRLNFRSPTLILGVGRNDPTEHRENAMKAMNQFIELLAPELPERIRAGFIQCCRVFFEKALASCMKPEGLTLAKNKYYHQEEERLIQWIAKVYKIKTKLFLAARSLRWIDKVKNLDFLENLDRLSRIPTRLNENYWSNAVTAAGLNSKYAEEMDKLAVSMALHLLQFIFDSENPVANRQEQLFRMLLASLNRSPDFWERVKESNQVHDDLFAAIDDGIRLYKENTLAALRNENEADIEAAVADLKDRCETYPGITGPARHLAILLNRCGRPEEAVSPLEKAIKQGFLKDGVEQCASILNHIRADLHIKQQNFQAAASSVRAMISKDPGDQVAIQSLIRLYQTWLAAEPENGPELVAAIRRDFSVVLDGNKLDASTLETVRSHGSQLTAQAALGTIDLKGGQAWSEVIDAMEGILKTEPSNKNALYFLMIASFQLGIQSANSGAIERAKKLIGNAESAAQQLLDQSIDDMKMKEETMAALENIRRAKEKLGMA